jgi:hypothetical protein
MADVTRPRGVTAAAIVALIGSVGAAGSGILILLAGVVTNRPAVAEAMARQPAPPFSPLLMMIVMGVSALAFAGWGCASAIAVLRLKQWGRLSFIVFGALLAAFGAMEVFGGAVMMALFSSASFPDPNVPRGFLIAVMGGMVVYSVILVAIGVWWLMMFNRAAVKTLFLGTTAEASDARRDATPIPIRVLVVAWMMVATILALPILLFAMSPMLPAFLFGFEIHGWLARVVLLAQFGLLIVAGIGLLRRRFGALALAIGVYVFGLINSAAIALRPGGFRHVMESYQGAASPQVLPPQFFDSIASFAMIAGLAFNLVLIALLISARGRYLRACTAPGLHAGS